jgi:hypothetical protein
VFRVQMTVHVVLVRAQEMEAMANGGASDDAGIDMNDPLLSTGIELGAEIKRMDNS